MTILVTAGAVILNEERKILLVLRPADKKIFPNCWALPGGKVEIGESLEDAVIREVSEETGLLFSSLEKYTFTEYISNENHNISHLFFGKHAGASNPETKAIWYNYQELSSLSLSFNQHLIFEDLYKKGIIS